MECCLPVHKHITRAELWAFLHVLMHALPPVKYITDHEAIITALEHGRRWCCSSRCAHLYVWRTIWWYIDELGGVAEHLASAAHTKAHRTLAQIQALGKQEKHRAKANRSVDAFAKIAADCDHDGIAKPRHIALERVRTWVTKSLEFIADLTLSVVEWLDVTPIPKWQPRSLLQVTRHVHNPHKMQLQAGKAQVWRC